jgi:hypothetical protein
MKRRRGLCAPQTPGRAFDHPERRYSRLVGRSEARAPERAGPRLRAGAQRAESAGPVLSVSVSVMTAWSERPCSVSCALARLSLSRALKADGKHSTVFKIVLNGSAGRVLSTRWRNRRLSRLPALPG